MIRVIGIPSVCAFCGWVVVIRDYHGDDEGWVL